MVMNMETCLTVPMGHLEAKVNANLAEYKDEDREWVVSASKKGDGEENKSVARDWLFSVPSGGFVQAQRRAYQKFSAPM